jgi:Carboxypeptidase regulatory-like domain
MIFMCPKMNTNKWTFSKVIKSTLASLFFIFVTGAFSQTAISSTQEQVNPSADITCVASALNRNATMGSGNSYFLIPGVPSGIGPYKVRAVCSDGTVGQTAPADFSKRSGSLIDVGNIKWGQVDAIPLSLELVGPNEISFAEQVAYKLVAKYRDGTTKDVTANASGAGYNLTPRQWWWGQTFATPSSPSASAYGDSLSANGNLTIGPGTGNNSRGGYQILITATYEGIAVAKTVKVGAWSGVQGIVTLPDGATPVAGAKVEIQRVAPTVRTAEIITTDAAGRYVSAATPIGNYKISVSDPISGSQGFATQTLSLGSIATTNIALNGSGSIGVNVVGANAQPISGAQVVVTHGQIAGQVQTALASSSGVAAFVRFMSGAVNVTVRDPATGAVGSAKINLQNAGTSNITVVLQPVGAIIGRVLSADGVQPQSGVQVRVASANKGAVSQVLTTAGGVFRFDALPLADSPYVLQAYKDGQLKAASGNLVLNSSGQQLQQDLIFGTIAVSGGTVSGRVVDQEANPYANTDLILTPAAGPPMTAKTDATGNYYFASVPKGSLTVAASAAGYSGQGVGVLASDAESITVNFQVSAVGEVRGIVSNFSGQPLANVDVELTSPAGLVVRRAVTNPNGEYTLTRVPLGGFSIVAISSASGERGVASGLLMTAGQTQNLDIKLNPSGNVRVVVSNGGVAVAGAKVGLTSQGAYAYGDTLTSDASGVVEFIGVPYGAFSISATKPGATQGVLTGRARGTLQQVALSQSINLGLNYYESAYNVVGRVVTNTGDAVPNALVRISSRDMPTGGTVPITNESWDEYAVKTDATGNFNFEKVWLDDDGRGRVKLDALVSGILRGRIIAGSPSANQASPKDIVLFDVGVMSGSVKTTAGTPIPAAQVKLVHNDAALYSPNDFVADTGINGAYTAWAATGLITASASSSNIDSAAININMQNQRTIRNDFVIGRILLSGRVATRNNLVLAGAEVRVNYTDPTFTTGTNLVAYTKPDGSYQFVLPAGTAYITARTQGRDASVITLQLNNDATQNLEISGISPRIKVIAEPTSAGTSFNVSINNAYLTSVLTGAEINPNFSTNNITHTVSISPNSIFADTISRQLLVKPEDEGLLIPLNFLGATVDLKFNVIGMASNAEFDVYIGDRYVRRTTNGSSLKAYLSTETAKIIRIKDASGEEYATSITIRPEDSGREVIVAFNVSASQSKLGKLSFGSERHVFSVPVQVGDVLEVSVHGDTRPTGNAAYSVKAKVFDPQDILQASGYGYGSAFNFGQYNEIGNLKGITATVAGNFAIQVQSYYPQDYYLGGYYLAVKVNGQSLALQPPIGGIVQGIVQKADGSPAANQTVEIWAAKGKNADSVSRVSTGQDGAYQSIALPFGEIQVKAIEGDTTLAAATSTIAVTNEIKTVNLRLAKKTTLNVNVRMSSGLPLPYTVYFSVSDDQGERSLAATLAGNTTSATKSFVVVGDFATLKAVHPYSAALFAEKTINGNDGQSINVELALVSGRVGGKVVNASGTPLANVLVTAIKPSNGQGIDATYTDSQGIYDFAVLAAGQITKLSAASSGASATIDVIAQENQTLTAPDIVLSTGSLRGRVLYANLSPVANTEVRVETTSGEVLYANTNGQGAYEFIEAPVGQALSVRATHPINGSLAAITVTVAAIGTTAPDLIFAATAKVSGRVRHIGGSPISGAKVVLSSSGISACTTNNGDGSVSASQFNFRFTTDASGNFSFEEVPPGVELILSTNLTSLGCIEKTQTVAALSPNESRALPDTIYAETLGTLRVDLVNGSGSHLVLPDTLSSQCPLTARLYGASGLVATTQYIHNVNGYLYSGVPYGNYYAEVSTSCLEDTFTGSSVNITDSNEKLISVVVPMVTGKVTEATGTPVGYPSVTLVQDKGVDGVPTVFYSHSDGQGNYIVVDSRLGTGSYTLTASGGNLNLSKSLTGTFITTPFLIQDIQLPGTGAISGRVLTSSGAAPGFGYLRIVNSALPGWERFEYMYGGSLNNNLRLPFGKNTIYFAAEDPAFNSAYSYASVEVLINSNFDSVALGDIYLLPFGTLEVSTLNQAGSALEGNQGVRVYSAQIDSYFTNVFAIEVSDSNGKAKFVLPAMPYSVVLAPNTRAPAGFVSTSVNGNNTTTVSLAPSGSLQIDWSYLDGLLTDNGVSFVLSEQGQLRTGSNSSSDYYYRNAAQPALLVENLELPRNITAQWMTSNRELQMGPYYKGNALKVVRRMFVPGVGGYARLLDSFTNLGTQTITINVSDTAPNRNGSNIKVPQTALESHIIFESKANFNGDYVIDPVLFGVVYGDGNTLKPVVLPYGNSDLLKWTITIPVGETVTILKFHILKDIDVVSAQNKANQIVNKSMVNMFEGLSTIEKMNIKNFTIQP